MAENRTFDPLALRDLDKDDSALKHVHVIGEGIRCGTEEVGYAKPGDRSDEEIVVDASEGFIPLWKPNVILRWRFAVNTLAQFADPAAAGAAIESLLANALLQWGDAAPIRFTKRDDDWDFEIEVKSSDDCNPVGCVLASAFFPDGGRHTLEIYPMLFRQDAAAQVTTLTHEIGHVFGLRHFFAKLKEAGEASELFGEQNEFTIMNYGDKCRFTPQDKADLKRLYDLVWSGRLTAINKTPIHLVSPFHETPLSSGAFAVAAARA